MQKLLITLLFLGSALSVTVNAAFGVNTTVSANTKTTISIVGGVLAIPIGFNFDIVTSADAQVSITSVTNSSTNLPSGYSNNTYNAGASTSTGFTLNVYPSSAFVNVTFSTGTVVGFALQASAIANAQVLGLLYVNSSTTASSFVDVDLYYAGSAGFQANLPLQGTYVFASVSVQAQVPSYYGWIKRLVANQLRRLWYQTELLVSVTASSNTSVTVTKSSSNPNSEPSSTWVSTGVFFQIELNTSSTLNATITYTYNEAKWATLNASRLFIGYFNTTVGTAGAWVFQPTSVNVSARAVTTSTTHFSNWAVYQDNSTSTSTTDTMATSANAATSATSATNANSANTATSATSAPNTMMKASSAASKAATTNKDSSAGTVGIAVASVLIALLL